jgi:hypothetical protein
MTEAATVDAGTPIDRPGKRPPVLRLPKIVQGVAFAAFRRKTMRHGRNRLGQVFEINVPFFRRTIGVSDPALVVCLIFG